MARTNILICGNYGAGNFGDELILKGLLKIVRELPNIHVTVMSGNQSQTQEMHAVDTCPFVPSSILSWGKNILNGNMISMMKAVMRSDLILLGGGGLFHEKEERSISIWWSQVQLFRFLRKKIIMVGQSFGNITKEKNKKMIKKVCHAMGKICVRDTQSKRNLEQLGITSRIYVIQDCALWLTPDDFKPSDLELPPQPYTILSLRSWPGIDLSQVEKVLYKKLEQQNTVHVPMLTGEPKNIRNLHDLWTLSQHAEAVIAMRLHAAILAHLAHKPLIILSYDDKVENLMRDLGYSSNMTQVSSFTQLPEPLQIPPVSTKADQYLFQNILTKTIKTI